MTRPGASWATTGLLAVLWWGSALAGNCDLPPASILSFDPGLREQVLHAIEQSRTEIAVEVYKLTDQGVAAALAKASQRGVKVRVILCPSEASNRSAAQRLRRAGAGVGWYPLSRPEQIMHLKMAVLDREQLLFGSANWTYWGLTLHHEGVLTLRDPALVARALEQFEVDWQRSSGQSMPARTR